MIMAQKLRIISNYLSITKHSHTHTHLLTHRHKEGGGGVGGDDGLHEDEEKREERSERVDWHPSSQFFSFWIQSSRFQILPDSRGELAFLIPESASGRPSGGSL